MKRCLVVDDSHVIRRVAAKILQDLGFETDEAGDGRIALGSCASNMPDAVFLDWEMPNLDGVGCLKELRRLPGGTKPLVIFSTVRNEPEAIQEALDAGADEFIMKPFDSDIVRAKFLMLGLLD